MQLEKYIREFPGFPEPGILFKDISPLLHNPDAMKYVLEQFALHHRDKKIDLIAGTESRGLIFASALATHMHKGLIMIRKKSKLPGPTQHVAYNIEYGSAVMEIQNDAIKPEQNILIVDDLLATGGTAHAAVQLIKMLRGNIVGFSFVIELTRLKGRQTIAEYDIQSLVKYDV